MSWTIPFLSLALLASPSDPYHLTRPSKIKHVKMIVEYAETHNEDPYELLAIAITESNLRPKVVSWAGAVGLFQVMCKYWYKPLKFKTIEQCNESLFNPYKNMEAGVFVLNAFRRNYKHCKGDLAYRCYYAGGGWIRRKGNLGEKINRYEKKVRKTRKRLHTYYKDLIEDIRSNVKERS